MTHIRGAQVNPLFPVVRTEIKFPQNVGKAKVEEKVVPGTATKFLL